MWAIGWIGEFEYLSGNAAALFLLIEVSKCSLGRNEFGGELVALCRKPRTFGPKYIGVSGVNIEGCKLTIVSVQRRVDRGDLFVDAFDRRVEGCPLRRINLSGAGDAVGRVGLGKTVDHGGGDIGIGEGIGERQHLTARAELDVEVLENVAGRWCTIDIGGDDARNGFRRENFPFGLKVCPGVSGCSRAYRAWVDEHSGAGFEHRRAARGEEVGQAEPDQQQKQHEQLSRLNRFDVVLKSRSLGGVERSVVHHHSDIT